ncbi:MAG: glycosyltransferase [Lentisphaeria bacterium]|nr:glycosyltransferase [Lentisphaeria bacterium]
MKQLDIVLPLYKPHGEWVEHILEAIEDLKSYFEPKMVKLNFVIVNDGSSLDFYPEEALQKIRSAAGNFQFLSYEKNQGKGYCIRFAMAQMQGDYSVYTDGDFPFGDRGIIDAFEALENGADVVMGVRGSEYGEALPLIRKMLSASVHLMNRILLGLPGKFIDTQAGLKGFNAEGRKIFLKTEVNSFVFDTEFILLAYKNMMNIVPIPIKLREGLHFSKMSTQVMLRELKQFLIVLAKYRFKKRKPYQDER